MQIDDLILGSIFTEETTMASITTMDFLICAVFAIVLGLIVGLVSSYKNETSKGFLVAMALLPVIVATVILLVNGNMGAAVAVFGVFSLVRFRSIPGTAKDIVTVFEAMAIGLACGMGFVGLACLMVLIVSIVTIVYASLPDSMKPQAKKEKAAPKTLRIVVPEDVDYDHEFDEVLNKYCTEWKMTSVETTNMGSLFQVKYSIQLIDEGASKQFIDDLRCLNGNLRVSLNTAAKSKENNNTL